jgi:beta-glucosidase
MHRRFFALSTAVLVAVGVIAGASISTGGPSRRPLGYSLADSGSCPWVVASRDGSQTPAALAAEVEGRMTLVQKVSFLVLSTDGAYENVNGGVPSLCIPPLTMTDGPNGIAFNATGVTQLPASIGLAASFDPAVTEATGRVSGAEARTKGLDVVQGPELNLARVPQSGRTFEAYGEDPYLTGLLGTSNAEGIQSQGVMADAKHLTAYSEETARVLLNKDVSLRALEELYDAPFVPVVQQAHVATVMCSYGALNGTNTCSDPSLFDLLRSWGFDGFVRSDLQAVVQPSEAFNAGLDLLKPATVDSIMSLVRSGAIHMTDIDAAVTAILKMMFAYGLIASPRPLAITADSSTAEHRAVALSAAERSMVLLKNQGQILPLTASTRSVAVIGADAGADTVTRGRGSAQVIASSLVSPITALRSTLGSKVKITYTPADAPVQRLPPIPTADIVRGAPLPGETPIRNSKGAPNGPDATEPGHRDVHLDYAPDVTPYATTATSPGTGPGWSSWSAVLEVPTSGTYRMSMEQDGDTWLYVNGTPVISSPGLRARGLWSTTIDLVAGRRYNLSAKWFAVTGEPLPQLGFSDVTPEIAAAVKAARQASVAVVFVSETQDEGIDRPNLSLPGDADDLISAVAAVNPKTIVVLNTGGAIVMPWLDKVAGVLEAWYPGQEGGPATAAVLEGKVDPSGHLPVTFPSVEDPSPVGTASQFPGVNGTVHYTEGLDIGYRWYQAHGVTPQFPFGYGLSYTSFTLSRPTLHTTADHVEVDLLVKNTGSRSGTAVVQAYVGYPKAAGEPPLQLKAVTTVALKPDETDRVQLTLPTSAFQAYLNGAFRTLAGNYSIDIGQSSANLPIHVDTPAPGLRS